MYVVYSYHFYSICFVFVNADPGNHLLFLDHLNRHRKSVRCVGLYAATDFRFFKRHVYM